MTASTELSEKASQPGAAEQADDGAIGQSVFRLILLLTFVNLFSYLDRIIMNLMIEPLKEGLGISDTQIALLQGISFGLFYTVCAIPIGRLADRYPRRIIISIGTAVFSLCTALSGLCRSFIELFFVRMGVGAGEASVVPCAHSLLGDTVPRHKLASALGMFTAGAFIGMSAAYFFGGMVVQWALKRPPVELFGLVTLAPWQLAFLAVGLPGFIAALTALLIREPRRSHLQVKGKATGGTFGDAWAFLKAHKATFIPLLAGLGVVALCSQAFHAWTPAFLSRVHGLSPVDIGLTLGLITLLCNGLGCLAAGPLVRFLQPRFPADAAIVACIIGLVICWIPSIIAPLVPGSGMATGLIAFREFFFVFTYPLAATIIQLAAPSAIRGQMAAVYMLAWNIVGLGLGPLVIGLLSDNVFTGADGIRHSLSWMAAVCIPLACLLLWLARNPYRRIRHEAEVSA